MHHIRTLNVGLIPFWCIHQLSENCCSDLSWNWSYVFEGLFGTRIFKKRIAELEKQEREALAAALVAGRKNKQQQYEREADQEEVDNLFK